MHWEIYQQSKIHNAESDARRARDKSQTTADEVRRLQRQVERLSLACQSMWELLRDSSDLTEEDLERKMLEIDERDGIADNRMSRQVVRCTACGRNTNTRRNICLMCGAAVEKPHQFEG